MKSKSKINQKK